MYFQGIKCVEGYMAIERSSYMGLNLNNWFTAVFPIRLRDKLYAAYTTQGFCMSCYADAETKDHANVYKCYMPNTEITNTDINLKNNKYEYKYNSNIVYVSDEIVNFNSNAPQNKVLTYENINKNWDSFTGIERYNIIRHRTKDFDIEKLWNWLTPNEKRGVIQYQIFNFDIDKHWNELDAYEKDLVCRFQICNFDIDRHLEELTYTQQKDIYKMQPFNLDINLHMWSHLLLRMKGVLYYCYYKVLDIDYEKTEDTWSVILKSPIVEECPIPPLTAQTKNNILTLDIRQNICYNRDEQNKKGANMKTRIKELEAEIIKCNKSYYNKSTLTVPDPVYDGLKSELASLDPTNPLLEQVGEECFATSKWNKVAHGFLIGSLDKFHSYIEALNWIRIKKIVGALIVMHKYDGLTIVCDYVNGTLVRAVTRGDGITGEDVTKNALLIPSMKCHGDFTGTIRGEIIVTKKNFKNYFKSANARNIASGTLKRSSGDTLTKDLAHLDVYFYEILSTNATGCDTRRACLNVLGRLFDNRAGYYVVNDYKKLEEIIAKETALRSSLPYNIDGLVIRSDTVMDENKRRPDYARAYKFEAEQASTIIKDVKWTNTGKAISPVAILEPVWLDGSTVSKTSIHNVEWLTKKNIGIGAKVIISKRGDIIPQIECVTESGSPVDIPKLCPECGSPTVMNNQFLICSSKDCPAKNRRMVKKLFRVLDINFAGDKTIELIANDYQFINLIKIFNNDNDLKYFELKLASYPRMGEKSAHKIIVEIKNKRDINLMQAFWMLDIDGFSSSRIEKVIEAGYDTIDKLINISVKELKSIKGFDDMADVIVQAIADNFLTIMTITESFKVSTPSKNIKSASMGNFRFVLTGALSKSRKEIAKDIEAAGHTMDKAITGKTDYLVAGDGPWGSKHKKAEKLGVKVINEEELLKLL